MKNQLAKRILYGIWENLFGFVVKCLVITVYIIMTVSAHEHRDEIVEIAEKTPLLSPVSYQALTHIDVTALVFGGLVVIAVLFYPFGRKSAEHALRSIGMVNHMDAAPELRRKRRDKSNSKVAVWCFRNNGIPLRTWEDRLAEIETALGITVVDMRYNRGNQQILLYTVPAASSLPDRIEWKNSYLSRKSFELVLGEGYSGPVTVNLADIPHILLGGSTGSGKSVLLKCLILQALKKGAQVAIADFKGGVDFPRIWRKQCRMCFDEESLVELLDGYTAALQERKRLFSDSGAANLDEYNHGQKKPLPRYILACDEIAEVLDKTGLTKEQKELVARIESRLSLIARQGRAFGIHLILATQRPDANILSGQIRNNINCRICGRADSVLSQIILDSTAAADKIPKHAKGLFMLHDGTVFQGFLLDESTL